MPRAPMMLLSVGVVSCGGRRSAREASTWAEAVTLTERLMSLGAASIFGACLEVRTPLDLSDRVFTIRVRIDRLERIAHLGEAAYAPVLTRDRSETVEADGLVLDLWVWALDALNGAPPPAELWLGVDELGRARRRIPHDYDETRVLDALTRAAGLLALDDAPPVRLIDACKTCPHRRACEAVARQAGSARACSISRGACAEPVRSGIQSLADVAATPDLLQVKGSGGGPPPSTPTPAPG